MTESLLSNLKINRQNISIGGYQFNGQWVDITDRPLIFTSTAIGTYTADITEYLPDDEYTYEIMLAVRCGSTSSTSGRFIFFGTEILPIVSSQAKSPYLNIGGNAYQGCLSLILPTKTRTVTMEIQKVATGTTYVGLLAYRRANPVTSGKMISQVQMHNKKYEIGGYNFDGQWINVTSRPLIESNTKVGTYTVDISSYLPRDNYTYEVLLSAKAYFSATSGSHRKWFGTDIIPVTTSSDGKSPMLLANESHDEMSLCPILPTKDRIIHVTITGNTSNNSPVRLIAYRRMGTNE